MLVLVRSNRKAISPLLSGILFTAITISATMLVFSVLIPKMTNLQESVAVDQGQLTLNHINDYIKTIVDEGVTSQRVIPISFKKGQIIILSANSTQNGKISYKLETETIVISPRTKKSIGDLVYSSNAYATLTRNSSHITLTNSRMTVYINRFGNSSDPVDIDISSILENIYLKDYSKSLFSGDNLNFEITGLPDPSSGYVYAKEVGSDLGRAEAIADFGDIDIHFILESGADYLEILITCSDLDNPPSTIAINLTSADYISSDLYKGSRYVYTRSGGYMAGLVNYNHIAESSVSGNTLSASIPFDDNRIYLPFTRTAKENMDQRLVYISSSTFDDKFNPSFGYKIDDKNKILLYLAYDDIYINYGSSPAEKRLRPGSYELIVRYDDLSSGYRYITVQKV